MGEKLNDNQTMRKSWQSDGKKWDQSQLQDAAKQAISFSDMHLAIDIASTAIGRFGLHPTSQYYLALAYANCGSREEVFTLTEALMSTIKESDDVYVDALCLVGRLEKDKFVRESGNLAGDTALANALEAYHNAYQASGDSFPGINAATLFQLADAKENSRDIAVKIITRNASDLDEFWQIATLAEAHLLLEEFDSARHYYQQVVDLAGTNYGLLASVKKHLPLIAEKIRIPNDIEGLLGGPAIAVFTGHMFDTLDRTNPRFPLVLKQPLAAEIGEFIDSNKIKIGYSSGACGGDLIFCREILNRGLELNIVLPFATDEFRRTSVALNGVDESMEYWDILKHANSVTIATDESHLNNPALYTHAANLIEGYAQLRAKQCDGNLKVVAAIDPYATGESGGSLERTGTWLEEGLDVSIIDIGKLRGEVKTHSILPTQSKKIDDQNLGREIKSLVEICTNTHDDVVHRVMSSKVPQDMEFMRGEGINRAFSSAKEAVDYAYHVRALAQMIKWEDIDLPKNTQLQIAIHTGPIFPHSKTKDRDYFGTHVFYAKELAEVTPPGCIYLTEQAAALLETHGPLEFSSDYLGQMDVKSRRRDIYRLHRA
ncbi:MAG: tetratricopeptide (TPR) repeat protein [Patiriisocius sp.]